MAVSHVNNFLLFYSSVIPYFAFYSLPILHAFVKYFLITFMSIVLQENTMIIVTLLVKFNHLAYFAFVDYFCLLNRPYRSKVYVVLSTQVYFDSVWHFECK